MLTPAGLRFGVKNAETGEFAEYQYIRTPNDAGDLDAIERVATTSYIDSKFGNSFLIWRSESDSEPDSESEPEVNWTTNELKAEHVGDIYLNSDGLCWEYSHSDTTGYYWKSVADSYLIAALALAKQKARCFIGTYSEGIFTGEYSKGDLWVNATYGNEYTNEMLVCNHNGRWNSFNIDHWQVANSYTTALNNFITNTYNTFVMQITRIIEGLAPIQLSSFAMDGVTRLSSFNKDNNGQLVYYYPDGQVMREDQIQYDDYGNATGVRTIYYNDDDYHTVRWTLDENGTLTQPT